MATAMAMMQVSELAMTSIVIEMAGPMREIGAIGAVITTALEEAFLKESTTAMIVAMIGIAIHITDAMTMIEQIAVHIAGIKATTSIKLRYLNIPV